MAGVYKGLTIKLSADTTGLTQSLGSIDAKGKALARNLKQVEKALKVDPKNTELLRQKFEGLGEQVKNTEERLKTLKQAEKEIGKSGMSTDEWNSLQREIAGTEANLKTYTKQFKEANAQYAAAESGLGQLGSKISEIGETLTPVGEKMQSVGGKMTAAFTTTALAAGTASVKIAMDFETSLAKVSTLADESVMSIDEIGDGARKLATEYGVSATQINEALYQAMSASVETGKALEFVGEATKLSKAGFTESAVAVDVLTTAINAYGMSAEDAAHISDVLVNTQNLGKTTVNELAASMGNVIPTAAAYGVNLENLASAYAVMTKQGINTANATTAINGMLTELANNGSDVNGILQDMSGKTFAQLMRDGASLGDVMSMLNEHVNGDTEAFANLWGNIRASKGALAIANAGADEFNKTLDSMVNSAGTVDAAFSKMGGTTQAQFNKMKASIEDAAISVGQALIPVVQDIMGVVKGLADAFNGLSEEEQHNIIRIAAFVAGLGPAITLLGTLMVNVERVGNGLMSFAQLLAKIDIATGGAARGVRQLDAATGQMTTTATKASVAMGALKAGAAAAAVAGVIILVNAIKDYVEKQAEFKQATDGLVEAAGALDSGMTSIGGALADANAAFGIGKSAVRDYHAEVEKLAKEQADLATQMSDSFTSVAQSNGALQIYADKIKELAGNCDGSAEKLAELQVAIDGYNSVAGTSYEITDETTGAINASTEALQNNANAWKANAEAAALQSAMTGVYEERIKLEQEVADTHEASVNAQKAYNDELASGGENLEAYRQQLASAEEAEKKANELLEANYEAEKKLTDKKIESDAANKLATASVDDYRNALERAGRSIEELDDAAGRVGVSTEDFVEKLKEGGITVEDFASVGVQAFDLLYQQSGQDMKKVKQNIDMLNAAGIDPKTLYVDDDGTIRDCEGRVIDLDKQTIDDKDFSVYAETWQAEQAIWRVKSTLDQIQDKNVRVKAEGVLSGVMSVFGMARGGFARLHGSGGFGLVTNGPTLLGYDANGIAHIAGEAGREWVKTHADGTTSIVPIENRRYLKPYAEEIASMIGSGSTVNNTDYHITVNASGGGEEIAREVTKAIRAQNLMAGRR